MHSPPASRYTHNMTIWGIIIGGAAGFAMGGPIGALLGAAAGHVAGRGLQQALAPEQTRNVAFTVAVIALSAKMARTDGVVTRAEIDAFRSRVDIPEKDIAQVARFWDLARQTANGFDAYARQTVALFGERAPILEQLLDLLFFIARSDKEIAPSEWAYLREVAEIFGYDDAAFERLSEIYATDDAKPHQILGLDKDATSDAIKTRWKQLARDHHPDHLIAKGMPAEFIEAATDRLARINRAYDLMMQAAKEREG